MSLQRYDFWFASWLSPALEWGVESIPAYATQPLLAEGFFIYCGVYQIEEDSIMSQEQKPIRFLALQAIGAFVSFVLFVSGCFQIASSLLLDWSPPIPDVGADGYWDIHMKYGSWPIHFYAGCCMVALSLTFFWVNRRRKQSQ